MMARHIWSIIAPLTPGIFLQLTGKGMALFIRQACNNLLGVYVKVQNVMLPAFASGRGHCFELIFKNEKYARKMTILKSKLSKQ